MAVNTAKLMHQEQRSRAAVRKASGPRRSKAIRMYLESYAAKIVAVHEAFESLNRKPTKEAVQSIARDLNPWEPCAEKVILDPKQKPNDPEDFRYILKFGLVNRARQILVRNALWTRGENDGGNAGELSPEQYLLGGGRDKAIKQVQKHYRKGFNVVFETDVYHCFKSFDRKGIARYLNLPERVVTHVLSGESLNIYLSKRYEEILDYSHSDEMSPMGMFSELESDWEPARLGLIEGSKASSFAAEKLLAWVCKNVPSGDWRIVNFADNFLCLCKNETAALALSKILRELLQQHPAGRLKVKNPPRIIARGNVFEFLGYTLIPKKPLGLEVRWSERADKKARDLRRAAYRGLNAPKHLLEKRKTLLTETEKKHLAIVNGYQLWSGGIAFHNEKMEGLRQALKKSEDDSQ